MSRPIPFVLCLLLAGCARKAPPAAVADTASIHTSVGMGGSLVVPRFVGTWSRPSATRAGQMEALVMERGGGLKFLNICTMRGVSWAEIPGDTLALATTIDGATAPDERHFHIQRFTDSLLALEGKGYESGSWMRSSAPVVTTCPNP
jgi:Lipocalin-like